MRPFAGLVAAELVKLRHTVAFRAVALALLVGPGVVIFDLRLIAADITDVVEDPGQVVLGTVVLVAAIGVVVLAAASLGREFDAGTVRGVLVRGAPRIGFLGAKTVVILLSTTAASLVASTVGTVEAVLAGWEPSVGEALRLIGRTLSLVPLGCLVFLGLVMIGAIVGRSTAAGMLAGLTLFLGDFLLSTLRTPFPLSEWMPVASLLTLVGGSFAAVLPPDSPLTAGAAVLRLLTLGVGLHIGAGWLFVRQDATS